MKIHNKLLNFYFFLGMFFFYFSRLENNKKFQSSDLRKIVLECANRTAYRNDVDLHDKIQALGINEENTCRLAFDIQNSVQDRYGKRIVMPDEEIFPDKEVGVFYVYYHQEISGKPPKDYTPQQ